MTLAQFDAGVVGFFIGLVMCCICFVIVIKTDEREDKKMNLRFKVELTRFSQYAVFDKSGRNNWYQVMQSEDEAIKLCDAMNLIEKFFPGAKVVTPNQLTVFGPAVSK